MDPAGGGKRACKNTEGAGYDNPADALTKFPGALERHMAQMNYVYKNADLRVEKSTMEFQHIQELNRRLKYFNKHTALAASQCKFLEEHLDQLHSDVGSTSESSIRGRVLECPMPQHGAS